MSGYVLLPQLFTATEIDRLRDAVEQVHAAVVSAAEAGETRVTVWPDGHRLEPFVAKLNFKRAGVGSEFAWHQDFPYWYGCAGDAAYEIGTAIVMLDDNTVANGAMTLVPGSHLDGPARRDPREPTGLFVDPAAVDESAAVTIEAPAGSVLMFPGLMVHRSAPNRTATDRRSLLFCFQPAGRPELSA
jgi:ectoine hydroxylase-related dioxygenase (phytanoyl-CoA dioxygenase family)